MHFDTFYHSYFQTKNKNIEIANEILISYDVFIEWMPNISLKIIVYGYIFFCEPN
jgi:hypothetical protein